MNKRIIRILAFDPGWETTGWAVLDVTLQTGKVEVIRFGQKPLAGETRKVHSREISAEYGNRTVAMGMLDQIVMELIDEYKPHFIASEDAFFSRFPQSHRALVEWITVLALRAMKHRYRVYLLAPCSIKQAMTGSGNADKNNIQSAILACPDIHFRQKQKVASLGEHEGDGIAVGYAFIKLLLPGVLDKAQDSVPEPEASPESVEVAIPA